jgi:hypothetical protein
MATWTIRGQTLRVVVPPEPADGSVVVRAVREAIEDPEFGPGLGLLIDARENESTMSPETPMGEVRNRAASISRLGFRSCALVISPVAARRGLAATFAKLAEEHGLRTSIFEDLARAEAWLVGSPVIGPEAL